MALTPDQIRRQIEINEKAAEYADENVELRQEVALLRKALAAALAGAQAYEQAEKERAAVVRDKDALLDIADKKIAEERRNGKKRAIRWGLWGLGVGAVLAAVAAN